MDTDAPVLGAELLVEFLNTLDVEEGTDVLGDAAGLGAWADAHGVEAGDGTVARQVRDALRSVVGGEGAKLPFVGLEATCSERSVGFSVHTAAEAAVASSLIMSVQGRFARVKLCAAEDCRWAFYDKSRNGSRTWCSMGLCGNRQKARTYRAKQPGDEQSADA